MADLVIRGGTVIDGSGGDPFEADVAVEAGKIVAVGEVSARGSEEIDARGKIVTPGFVDPHSHYDAQATWSSQDHAEFVAWGDDDVDRQLRRRLRAVRSGGSGAVDKIDGGRRGYSRAGADRGIPWNWRSFPDFLNALEARPYDLDIATQVPHAAVRVHVMGKRGVDREPATAAESREMARIAVEGIQAGALGFSTSRTINHKTKAGAHIPTLDADEAELGAIAEGLRGLGAGWMQVISDFDDPAPEFAMLRRLVVQGGRPMAITILQRDAKPEEWRQITGWIAEASRAGLPMLGQVLTRPTGIILGFEISQNPFLGRPSFDAIADLPFEQKIAELRRPERRAAILAEETGDDSLRRRVRRWDRMCPMSDPPNYEPSPEDSIAAIAARMGRDPADVAYDLLLENNGKTLLYRPLSNYSYGNLDTVHDMLAHDATIVGLGDGGAHVGILSDASALSTMLTHWTRDRKGARFSLPWGVKRISRDSAMAIGLHDRGLVARGYKADLNVIDYDRLSIRAPEVVYDLPTGGRRLIQRADGYEATIVSGVTATRNGEATGALPGRLVRGARAAL